MAAVKQLADPQQFRELREVYVYTSHYKPYSGQEFTLSQAMFMAMDKEQWDECQTQANSILDDNYISLYAHYGAMVCALQAGNMRLGEYHKYALDGLINAIWDSGDGKSPQSAFYCTSTPELQAFIFLHGLEILTQALIHHDDRSYDLMGVRDPERDEQFSLYFDISAQFTRGFTGVQ